MQWTNSLSTRSAPRGGAHKTEQACHRMRQRTELNGHIAIGVTEPVTPWLVCLLHRKAAPPHRPKQGRRRANYTYSYLCAQQTFPPKHLLTSYQTSFSKGRGSSSRSLPMQCTTRITQYCLPNLSMAMQGPHSARSRAPGKILTLRLMPFSQVTLRRHAGSSFETGSADSTSRFQMYR